ncbi:MAG: TonB-dependent receptor, partial [Desulfuromonadales bacterium]|nr:TonB-dependent receptor [Desulfuromonadales bacterium]
MSDLEAALGLPAGTFFAAGQGQLEAATMSNQALSLFAQVDFNLGDRSTVTLGVNYTEDEKDVTLSTLNDNVFSALDLVQIGEPLIAATVLQGLIADGTCGVIGLDACQALAAGAGAAGAPVDCADVPAGVPCNPLIPLQQVQVIPPVVDFPNSVENGQSKDDQTTWTARFAFDVTDQLNAYVSAGTGFKATSWNLSRDSRPFAEDIPALEAAGLTVPNLVPASRLADPEDSTLYEIGLKGAFDNWSFNLAVF